MNWLAKLHLRYYSIHVINFPPMFGSANLIRAFIDFDIQQETLPLSTYIYVKIFESEQTKVTLSDEAYVSI